MSNASSLKASSQAAARNRSQLLIDRQVQLPILQRTLFYTAACAVYFMVVLIFSESSEYGHESASRTFQQCFDVVMCWAPGLMLLAPIIAYDILLFSNRFAGPIYRLRREMQQLIDNKSERPMSLRDQDFWPEFADLFNQLRQEMIELRSASTTKKGSLFSEPAAARDDFLTD
jgi:hypothetical protein